MNPWKTFVIGTLCFVTLCLSVSVIMGHGHFLLWLTEHRSTVLDYSFFYVTKLGEEYGFVLIGVIYLFGYWRRSLMIASIGLTVTLATYVLKKIIQFERPSLFLNRIGWEGPLGVLDYPMLSGHSSFPSGHSMAAWALFTFVAAVDRRPAVAIISFLIAASVSLSRVYLMAHFLRDVAVGAALGFAIGYLFFYLYDTRLKIK